MAEASDSQNPCNCPVCLDLLNDPVTSPCGHSFCMICLNQHWDKEESRGAFSCPQCRQTFQSKPALSRNTVLNEVVEKMRNEAPEAGAASVDQNLCVSEDVECDVCTDAKLKAVKTCVSCVASYCEAHIQAHYTSAALKRHKLVNPSPHLLDQICSVHNKHLELFCCQDQQLICIQCALINHQNHKMTSVSEERQQIQVKVKSAQDVLQKKLHQKYSKVIELRRALDCYTHSAEAAVEHNETIFSEMTSSMVKRKAELTEMIRAQQSSEIMKVEELLLSLEQEISDLKMRHEELVQLYHKDDDIYVVQNFISFSNYQSSNMSDVTVSKGLKFEDIQTNYDKLKEQVDDVCEQEYLRISDKVSAVHVLTTKKYLPSLPKTRDEFLMYAAELNLNQSSACKRLKVTNKSASRQDSVELNLNQSSASNRLQVTNKSALRQDSLSRSSAYSPFAGENPTRLNQFFRESQQITLPSTDHYQVLCRETLSGSCYFEVKFTGQGCSIAFSYDQTCQIAFGSNNRSWQFDFPLVNIKVLSNNIFTTVPIISKIGVFFNQKEETLSFYSITEKMILLHKFKTNFTQPVYPGLSLRNWQNLSSISICDF